MVTIFDDDARVRRDVAGRITDVRIDDDLTAADRRDPRWSGVTGVWHHGRKFPAKLVRERGAVLRLVAAKSSEDGRRRTLEQVFAVGDLAIESLLVDVDVASVDHLRSALATKGIFPALRTLGISHFWAKPEELSWIWRHPILQRVERVRLAIGKNLPEIAPWTTEIPANVTSFELSFDFGWSGWTVEIARDSERSTEQVRSGGAFQEWRLAVRPLLDKRFGRARIDDLLPYLARLPPDAIGRFALAAEGVRVVKPDLEAIRAALGRQTSLHEATLPKLGTVPIAPMAAAPPVTLSSAAEVTSARVDDPFRAWVRDAALPAELARALLEIDCADPATWTRARCRFETFVTSEEPAVDLWGEAALRVLELPIEMPFDRARDRGQEALAHAAVRVLERTRPRGVGARLAAIFGREDGCRWAILRVAGAPIPWVHPGELPALLDWYESLADMGPVPAKSNLVYQPLTAMVVLAGDGSTWKELVERRDDPRRKLTRWKIEVYQAMLSKLEAKARRAKRSP